MCSCLFWLSWKSDEHTYKELCNIKCVSCVSCRRPVGNVIRSWVVTWHEKGNERETVYMIISFPRARKMGRAPVDTERKTHYTLSITLNEVKQIQRRNRRRQRLALLSSETYLRAIHERCPQNSDIFHSPPSRGLPIRQNRQLPKAPHGAGARSVQRKARKMFY